MQTNNNNKLTELRLTKTLKFISFEQPTITYVTSFEP